MMPESTDHRRLAVNGIGGVFLFSNKAKERAQLETDGVAVEKVEEFDYGRFAWIRDPDNNRVELYEPLVPTGGD